MSDLREDLDAALRTVEPGQAPVDAAIRSGRRIRARRRGTAIATAIGVVVTIAVGYPAVSHRAAAPAPTQPTDRRPVLITDTPPPAGAPAGVIAVGQVGITTWQVSADKSDGSGQAGRPQCFDVALDPGGSTPLSGSVLDNGGSTDCDLRYPGQGDPVTLEGTGGNALYVMAGGVAANVQYVVVHLAGGQVVTMIPHAAYGRRFVAYAAPASDRVLSATLRTDGGQLLATRPFIQPDGVPVFGLWATPGRAQPPTATVVLDSGRADGGSWSVTAYEGPWGTCVVTAASGPGGSSTACRATVRGTSLAVLGFDESVGSMPSEVAGFAPLAATHIAVTLTNGTSFQVPVMAVGNERLWSFSLAAGQGVRRLTARDSAGHSLGSTTLP